MMARLPSSDTAKPRVSLVMPVYNGARYLDNALQSVLDQDYRDFELICVDDGSTDATATILAHTARADSRVRHITNPVNIGLPATLNRGFREARGSLFSWTSHDNILRPAMLATLVAAIDEQPAADIVYAGYTVIDAVGNAQRYEAPKPASDRWFGNPVGAAFLYRSSVDAALGGYDEELFGAEDYDFWLRAARQFTLKPIDRDLYLYRRHGESLTDRRSIEIKAMVARLVQRELALIDHRGTRSAALLKLVLDDRHRWRSDLVNDAFRASPSLTVRALPDLARHGARIIRDRFRSPA